jgi:hypothetical protein
MLHSTEVNLRLTSLLGSLVLLTLATGFVPTAAAQTPGTGSVTAANGVSRADARRMVEKAAAIEERAFVLTRPGTRGTSGSAPATTVVTEREINSYLAFEAGSQIPVGVTEPRISILGDGRLSGTAVVDLDAVRRDRKATGWLDPMSYLTGRLPVFVTGTLTAANHVARFNLETARISGVPIPKTLLQELLTYYSRTPASPRGLSLDDPFPLPARIRQIDMRRGEALVVQQ